MPRETETYNDFNYIVKLKKEDRICFGNAVPRNTSPIKGLTSQQRMQVRESFPNTGPGCYDTEKNTSAFYPRLNKVRSKRGMAPVCNTAARFRDWQSCPIPSPGRYNTCQFSTKFKKNAAPFCNSGTIRVYKTNSTPGPGTYDSSKEMRCRRSKFMDNFGNPAAINAVEMICVKRVVDTCQKCNKICEGDYWQKDYSLFLCHVCFTEEFTTHEFYETSDLKKFKKIRNCNFMHDHQNTTAAIRILPLKKVRKKIELENYLSYYIK